MPPKKKANGYNRPESVPKNTVLADTCAKKKWILGSSIGSGGFGDIYLAAEGETPPKRESDYSCVVKIEPAENGPLFVERHFYVRVGTKDKVVSWMNSRKLKSFGMPIMQGCGMHVINGVKHRFVVLERFSKDLWSIFLQNNRVFPILAVLQIALQIHDTLEYVHHHDYVHADIKGANLLLGWKKGTENQVYLVDFGLACKISKGDYKRDPKKAHNGTLEYTSRDAHFGVPTRRGDYEVLAYNMIQWLTSKLPWEDIKDEVSVEKCKHQEMKDVPRFLKKCFGKRQVPDVISSFVQLIAKLEPNESPDYAKIRNILSEGIKAHNGEAYGRLNFKELDGPENSPVKGKRAPASLSKRSKAKLDDDAGESSAPKSKTLSSADDLQVAKRVRRTPIAKYVESDSSPEEEVQHRKATPSKKSEKSKAQPSWRDCPTVQVSRVVKAGEYHSLNPKRKKKNEECM